VHVSHLADQFEFFSLPRIGVAAAVRFLEHHLPAGFTISVSAAGTPARETDVHLDVATFSGAYDQPDLNLTITATRGGSRLRVAAEVPWQPPRPPGSDPAPLASVIEVTGYATSGPATGSLGPVTVEVTGQQATTIRTVLAGLLPSTYTGPPCWENEAIFRLDFVQTGKSTPIFSAADWVCPSPGQVTVSSDGRALLPLVPDCLLLQAVAAVLPHGQAAYTRRFAERCR
jgi:hypothetical protein